MPSPSRIPKPKTVTRSRSTEHLRETKTSPPAVKQKTQKTVQKCEIKKPLLRTDAKALVPPAPTQKTRKSPFRVMNENKNIPTKKGNTATGAKAILQDRRGISEIKRSEKNLRVALESMELEMESLKHEVQEKGAEVCELKSQEFILNEKVETLEMENAKKSEILEHMGHDPVTGAGVSFSSLFQAVLDSEQSHNDSVATEFLSAIDNMNLSMKNIKNRLDSNLRA